MSLEIWSQPLSRDDQGVDHFFQVQISHFGPVKDLADVVEGPLYLSFVFFDEYRGDSFDRDSEVQI